MREIASHKVNGLNESLQIMVMDEPGPGGACHEYRISWPVELAGMPSGSAEAAVLLAFQKGPIKENGANGISQEALLAIVRDRLESFQAGPYACDENKFALDHVVMAMALLHSRTKARLARGVEGTSVR